MLISIRIKEEVLVSVMKLIKRHFARLVRTYYTEEEYEACKNNMDDMSRKIARTISQKCSWSNGFTVYSKANDLLDELKNVQAFYETFIQYSKAPNHLLHYKVVVTLSMQMTKILNAFLEKEIAFQILSSKKPFKELSNVLDFQKNLIDSIHSFKDQSISVSIKADEYNDWEKIVEEVDNEPERSEDAVSANDSRFSDESALHKLGYKITGLSRFQRWNILTNKAIPHLGLDETVHIISGLIETRKLQQDGEIKYANAIKEWNHDLSRLADYY